MRQHREIYLDIDRQTDRHTHTIIINSLRSYLQPSINTTNIDTLLVATDQTERIVEPPENVQEKIAFIFNNLSQSNMTQKVKTKKQNITALEQP